MSSPGPIVIGVDGTDTADAAGIQAAVLANALGRPLHIVAAFQSVDQPAVDDSWAHFESQEVAESVVGRSAERYATQVAAVTTAAVEGGPAHVLVVEAKRLQASVIVIGNKGVQGAGRVPGNVAFVVAAHAPCDVYVVKTT